MNAFAKSPLARPHFVALTVALIVASLAGAAFAGGPLYTFDYANRIPYAWHMSSWPNGQVPIHTDLGNLGPLTNDRTNHMVAFAANQWSTVPTSTMRTAVVGNFSQIGLGDINSAANVTQVIGTWNGGGIDVVYDSDGSILTNFFGLPPTGVLGITNVESAAAGSNEILEAWMVLSGPGIHANDLNGIGFQGVVTHEMGHALNLAHSQGNGATWDVYLQDDPQPNGCPAPWFDRPDATQIETMYPFSTPEPGQSGEAMGTVDRLDDRSGLSDIYPAAGYPANGATIQGTVFDAFGTPVTGVNIIARNIADPFNDFSSYITGQVSKGQAGPDGSYILNDLTPGARYVIYVDNLEAGAWAVPQQLTLPGPEEFYNGATEGTDADLDNRCSWTDIEVTAGSPATADIKFQRYAGAPTLLLSPDLMSPTDITPDGSIVVGGYANYDQVVRWNLNTGAFEPLGGRMDGEVAISNDGTKIAANVVGNDGNSYAAIYTDAAGWTPIPPVAGALPCSNSQGGPTYTAAYDISGDGNTVVGLSYGTQGCNSATTRGFKWTPAGGTVALPKVNSVLTAGRANAVNYDGTVITGWDDASTGFRRGAVWKNGAASLMLNNAQWVGEGLDVTRDGLWVVGVSAASTSNQPWRYNTTTHAIQLLGSFGGTYDGASAGGIDDDNSVITGRSVDHSNGLVTAAMWTSQLHWFDFNVFLHAQGVNTAGIGIWGANAVSADGRTLAGGAETPFGFVGYAVKTPTSIVCHVPPSGAPQTLTVSFPQGLDTAIQGGDTLGPCPCSAAAPAGIPSVAFGAPVSGTAPMTWTSVSGATGYDVSRGSLSLLQSAHGNFTAAATDCLESALRANTYSDTDRPAAGNGFWYLVRAVSCGGHGTWDEGAPSQAAPRDAGMQDSPAVCP